MPAPPERQPPLRATARPVRTRPLPPPQRWDLDRIGRAQATTARARARRARRDAWASWGDRSCSGRRGRLRARRFRLPALAWIPATNTEAKRVVAIRCVAGQSESPHVVVRPRAEHAPADQFQVD